MRDRLSERVTGELVGLFKEARKRKGLSHQTVADAAGISRAALSFIENGQRTPTITTCLKLARALEVDLVDLIKKAQKIAQ